eukprot:CAMPEP_0206260074 /NCGR_PEP_ID=MMETSP0047_2-20121206/26872_1 /ASSEMBLY_ACC=CAM_ASM_000192 /TAXON_ID=195065 /ORGANISM="Chroomonas mesostigmatica_cf, Strain CCMP1168" /LENGTH=566 /DNA_ID=CAMNT_0053687087 /DNA_START=81 /DNA_END=1778 /DNA_ORIENTATION=-
MQSIITLACPEAPNPELTSLWKNQELLDVQIRLDSGTELGAHKVVLATNSRVLRRMLVSKFREGTEGELKLGEVGDTEIRAMLQFLYEGSAEVRGLASAVELARISDLYEVASLKGCVLDALRKRLTPSTAVDMLQNARRAGGLDGLADECVSLLRQSFRDLAHSSELAYVDKDSLIQIVEGGSINARDEDEIYMTIRRWAHAHAQDTLDIQDVLAHVRFPHMSPIFLREERDSLSNATDGPAFAAIALRHIEDTLFAMQDSDALHAGAWAERRYGGEASWLYSDALQPWLIEGHEGCITSLCGWRDCVLSSSEQYGPDELTLQVRNSKTWACEKEIRCAGGDVLCLHSVGETLYCGTAEGGVLAFSLLSWESLAPLCEHVGEITALTSVTGRLLVSGCSDATLLVWDIRKRKVFRQLEGHVAGITCLGVCNERNLVASGAEDLTVRIWRSQEDWVCDRQLQFNAGILCMQIVDYHGQLAIGLATGDFQLVSIESGIVQSSHCAHAGTSVRVLALNGDRQILTASDDRRICAWDLKTDGGVSPGWVLKVSEDAGIEDGEARALLVW